MNLERLRTYELAPVEQSYDQRDTMLYALGLGYGSDPLNASELRFVYEANLLAVPSQCVVLGHPGFWVRDPVLEIDWKRLLHGEQRFEIFRPIAPAGRVRAEFSVDAVDDKGPEKGAVMYQSKTLFDAESGEKIATSSMTTFLRGDGGCGSFGAVPKAMSPIEGEPTQRVALATLPQSALLYRLNGDYNPLHVDPAVAAAAGFARPILHGLCTLGVAVRALVEAVCGGDPTLLCACDVRFVKPVLPGETIETLIYREGAHVRFRARVPSRSEPDALVLDRGSARIA